MPRHDNSLVPTEWSTHQAGKGAWKYTSFPI
jgi:hypothetical protein